MARARIDIDKFLTSTASGKSSAGIPRVKALWKKLRKIGAGSAATVNQIGAVIGKDGCLQAAKEVLPYVDAQPQDQAYVLNQERLEKFMIRAGEWGDTYNLTLPDVNTQSTAALFNESIGLSLEATVLLWALHGLPGPDGKPTSAEGSAAAVSESDSNDEQEQEQERSKHRKPQQPPPQEAIQDAAPEIPRRKRRKHAARGREREGAPALEVIIDTGAGIGDDGVGHDVAAEDNQAAAAVAAAKAEPPVKAAPMPSTVLVTEIAVKAMPKPPGIFSRMGANLGLLSRNPPPRTNAPAESPARQVQLEASPAEAVAKAPAQEPKQGAKRARSDRSPAPSMTSTVPAGTIGLSSYVTGAAQSFSRLLIRGQRLIGLRNDRSGDADFEAFGGYPTRKELKQFARQMYEGTLSLEAAGTVKKRAHRKNCGVAEPNEIGCGGACAGSTRGGS